MRKVMTGLVAVILGAASVQAAMWTNGPSGDMKFSNSSNWTNGVFPVSGEVLSSIKGTTAGNHALVDPAFNIGGTNGAFGNFNMTAGIAGTAYLDVQSNATLRSSNITIGNSNQTGWNGDLTLKTGGAIEGKPGANFNIGTASSAGQLTLENGAALSFSVLTLGTNGTMNFTFGANSVTTFNATKGTTGSSNVLNGLVQVDLTALTVAGSYTLVDGSSTNLLIAGTMRTWLDSVGGSCTNTGDFTNANFQVIGGGTKQWALALTNGNQDLILTVIPVPVTLYTLMGSAGANGSVTPASTNVVSGGSAEFVITASNYYRIASLTTNGTAVTGLSFNNNSMATNFTWSNVQGAGVLVATFTNRSLVDSETVQKALADAGIFYQAGDSSNAVTGNLSFSTTTQDGVSLEWASSAPLIVRTNGTVYRPRRAPCIRGSAIPVTITVTASKNGVSDSRTFSINVVPSTNSSAPLYQGVWDPFWRAQPVIGEWLAGGQGFEIIPDYLKQNSFCYQGGANEIPFVGYVNAVRLIGGWNEGGGSENPVPADVADLVYKDTDGQLQYRWDKLALRLDPYITTGYTNLTVVLDNIPYCFVGTPVMESYGQVGSPTNFVEWRTFVSNLCVKLVDLYGFETANNFRFRQGTEAQSSSRFAGTQTQYFKIYDYSAAAVKSVLPGAKFGPFNQGGGKADPSANNVDIVALAKHCATGTNYATGTIGSPFDFIGISEYIAQANHSHDPKATADADIAFFQTVQAELPNPVSWEAHEFGILKCESGLSTDEPGARGAAWDFHMMSRLRECGLGRWYHWGIFDTFRSADGLHDLMTSHGWLLAVLDRTAGGEAFSLNTTSTVTNNTQVRAVGILGGDRDWILAGIHDTNRLNHTSKTISIRVPQNLLRANPGDKVLWTSLNQTNSAHYFIRKDLEATGMLNAAFSAVPEQLSSVKDMTTNSSRSAEQDFLGTQLPRYEQAVIDSLTFKPFPGTVTTNSGDIVFTITLTPPETAVICIGPDRTADGVPYAWLDSYGWATNGYATAGQDDPDGDGYTSVQEYIAGTDPTNKASVFKLQGTLKPGTNGTDILFSTITNRNYSIYSRTNLVNGSWILLKGGVSGTNGPVTISDTNRYSPVFYRLKVNLP